MADYNAKSFCQHTISVHVWRKHKEAIRFNINKAIVPSLVQERLIPIESKAADKVSDHKLPECDRKDVIVSSVPKCGQDDFLVKFIACLRATVDDAGEAHTQLADLLEKDYTEMMEKGLVQETFTQSTCYDPETGVSSRTTSLNSDVVLVDIAHGVSDTRARGGFRYGSLNGPFRNTKITPKWYLYIKATLKAKRKRLLTYCTSLLWLLLGAIGYITLSHVLVISNSQTKNIIYSKDNDSFVNIDLGIDSYWLSGALLSLKDPIGSTSCTARAELYVLPMNCQSVPMITTPYINQYGALPFYLLQNSSISISISKDLPTHTTNAWSLHPWIHDCDNHTLNGWSCGHPPEATYECTTAQAGDLVTFVTETSDYYAFCTINWLRANDVTLTVRSYNITAIQKMSQHKIGITSKPTAVDLDSSKPLCLVLDVTVADENCNNYISPLDIEVIRRKDILLIPIILGVLGFFLHITIAGISHFCYTRLRSGYHTV